MGSASKLYLKGIYNRFSYLATWLPNANLRLGDVGLQQGDAFKQMTTLTDLGIPFRMRKGANTIDFTYTSESGVTVKTKAAGEVAAGTSLPLGQAGISIQFSREGAFLFQAVGCSIEEIDDKVALGQAVIKLVKNETWNPSWAVVDMLVRADTATIMVSNSGFAGLDLTAKAPVAVANLANVDTGLSVSSQTGDIIRFIAAKGLAPLFRLSKMKQSFLSGIFTFGGPVQEAPASEVEDNPLEVVAPE